MGFYMLIILAGLQAIPRDIYEAAAIDGTSQWRQFWCLTLPLLIPNLLVVTVLLLIRSVQVFDEAWVLTNGGGPERRIPSSSSSSTRRLSRRRCGSMAWRLPPPF